VLSAGQPLAARLVLPPALEGLAAEWRTAVIGRIPTSISPADQLEQLALWLTLEAEPLPSPETIAKARMLAPAIAVVERPERGVLAPPQWWWVALALAAAIGVVGRRCLRRREPQRRDG
jgi:hypothetical protein